MDRALVQLRTADPQTAFNHLQRLTGMAFGFSGGRFEAKALPLWDQWWKENRKRTPGEILISSALTSTTTSTAPTTTSSGRYEALRNLSGSTDKRDVRALIQLYQRVGKHEKDSVEHALRRITNVDSFGSPLTEGAREKSALELWGRFASESAPAAPATPAALADALRPAAPRVPASQPSPGLVRRLTEAGLVNRKPQWTPDGRHIVFLLTREGETDLYVMEADGRNPRAVTRTPLLEETFALSPDGQSVVVGAREGPVGDAADRKTAWTLSLHQLEGGAAGGAAGAPPRVVHRSAELIGHVGWRFGGRHIAFVTARKRGLSEEARFLASPDTVTNPEFDGEVYEEENESEYDVRFWIMNADGSAPRIRAIALLVEQEEVR